MFSKNHYINWISVLLIFLINQIFIIKYLSRVTDYFFAGSLFFTLLFFSIIFINKRTRFNSSTKDNKYYYLIAIILASLFFVIAFAVPESSNVNRIREIRIWLENLNDGIYPYLSRENPSSFPFLFLSAAPFYYLNILEAVSAAGVAAVTFLSVYFSSTKRELFLRLSLIAISLPLYYEAVVKSELTFNIALLIVLILLTQKFADPQKSDLKFFLLSIFWGFALSTRMIAFVVFIIFLLFYFRQRLFNLYLFASLSLLVFLLTNLPFFLWYPELFVLDGPFAVQSSYMPFSLGVIFMIFIIYAGWSVSNLQELFFATGIILFLLASTSFAISVWNYGFHNTLFNSYFDIAYFIFSIPFFILSVEESKVDKFLGKVLV